MKVTRRSFAALAAKAAAAACSLPILTAMSRAIPSRTRRPSIIYILADDLGYGDLGCYGQRKIRTPQIDRMAAEGMRFTDHYAGSAVCAPSRCCLVTGMHAGHARIRNNADVPLQPDDPSIAAVLKDAGYATAVIGKWGLGEAETTGAPWHKGFDYFYGFLDQTHAHGHYPSYLFRNADRIEIEANKGGKRGAYANDLFTDEAASFIEKNSAKPFFLYLAYTIPHAELLVPEDSMKEYEDLGWPEKPFPGGHYAAQPKPNAARAGMITRLDRDVGRLLALLRTLGIEDETLVIFASDNGPAPGAGGTDPAFFNSSGPLRGTKFNLYEGGTRVPFIARWPGRIKAGSTCALPSAFWDMLPTFADLAGTAAPPCDGISFAPALLGMEGQKEHPYLYWELGGKQAVRMGQWKAVRQAVDKPIELYDLAGDIGEQHDVAKDHPDVVAQMGKLLQEAHRDDPNWPLVPKPKPAKSVANGATDL